MLFYRHKRLRISSHIRLQVPALLHHTHLRRMHGAKRSVRVNEKWEVGYSDKVISFVKMEPQFNMRITEWKKRKQNPSTFWRDSSSRSALKLPTALQPFCVADAAGARDGDARTERRTDSPAQLHASEMDMGGCGCKRKASSEIHPIYASLSRC